jgi:hypothetical protein
MRWSTTGARKAELTGLAHDAKREKGMHGGNGSALANRAREIERERESERAKETSADKLVPLGSERERVSAREGELPLTGGVCLSGGAGARAHDLAGLSGLPWAGLAFPISLFLMPFLFIFSRVFNSNSN